MTAFLEIDHVDRVFSLPDGNRYIALKNIHLKIQQGEFVCLLGHSGCGKSTLLNIVAGLDRPTQGGIILENREVKEPGPDRMVVFQNYSLLPWKTVRENITLAVEQVYGNQSARERKAIVEEHINMVNLRHAADKYPAELSGGMKQRVAIARALAIRPKLLLLDEPFGALDALTRGSLQEQLMKICQEHKLTCLMVTHDADEALLLADRIVMLTNGPQSHIGQILTVPIPRPRNRLDVVNHPSYYKLRGEIVYFLNQQKKAKKRQSKTTAIIAKNGLEKVNLNIGFMPLTDCAPLVVAKEKGFFAKHGLTEVNLLREPSWKAIAQGVASGRLDAAQMLASMPLALSLGMEDQAPIPTVTALTLSRHGNAITLSRQLYDKGVRTLADFKRIITQNRDKLYTLGMVNPASVHNLMLRYWLASGGIDPDVDVKLIVVPPVEMVANLKAGYIDGYCVGEPWNSQSVAEELGFVIATDSEIWQSHVEKVLGVKEDWANQYPATHIALVKALIEACEYCDDFRHREEILDLICQPNYVGSDPNYTRLGFVDPYHYRTDKSSQPLSTYNEFYLNQTNCPSRVDGLWILVQMARWGLVPFPRNWIEVIDRVRRIDVYSEATAQLNLPGLEPDRTSFKLSDGTIFSPDNPLEYLQGLKIKRDIRVQEIDLDSVTTEAA
ncbi:nitrate ABC transporter, ATPase subunits C and D [Rippkaea orientalis PCC 8801]|uniref:Nitrate ABC transporter, ATPase subunits C and D n=1 Tax=Rippkaea orientalis (strain PCC 8801 / RF-1) TaxID=41431 RepID=B7JVI3_RIPO1|nr:nitrate ABC transporter ATP-binding protein [Rippkaea orientalis]ACK68316.1 nitrate ABC transporter, ATPase subunits C and D [Rippkaea orientalis PCC 8801]